MKTTIKTLAALLLIAIIIICQREMTIEAHQRRHQEDLQEIDNLKKELKLMKSAYTLKCYEGYQSNEPNDFRITHSVNYLQK